MTLRRIDSFGQFPLVLNPPYSLESSCSAFALVGDQTLFAEAVNSTFGWAKDHILVEPWTDALLGPGGYLVAFFDYALARASGPVTGTFKYKEIVFYLPVRITNVATGERWPSLYVAGIYVDSPLATAAGREIYGFTKKPATMVIPERAAFLAGAPYRVIVHAAETTSSAWRDEELFRLAIPPLPDAFSHDAPGVTKIANELATFVAMPIVLMKQISAADPGEDGRNVMYRAVVTTMAPITAFDDYRPLPPGVGVSIRPLATEQLTSVFGTGHPNATFAGTFKMSFDFKPGKVLYEERG